MHRCKRATVDHLTLTEDKREFATGCLTSCEPTEGISRWTRFVFDKYRNCFTLLSNSLEVDEQRLPNIWIECVDSEVEFSRRSELTKTDFRYWLGQVWVNRVPHSFAEPRLIELKDFDYLDVLNIQLQDSCFLQYLQVMDNLTFEHLSVEIRHQKHMHVICCNLFNVSIGRIVCEWMLRNIAVQ